MKNGLALLLLGFLCVLFGCTKQGAQEKGTDQLIIGTNANYSPYVWVDKGEVVGFDRDVLEKMGEKLNKKIVIHDMSFDSLILALNQGKVDMIMGGISITAARKDKIEMIPYQGKPIKSLMLVFWTPPSASYQTWSDLKGLKVVVQTGTLQDEFLQSVPDVIIKTLDGNAEMVMDVQHKKSDAALFEPHIANELKAKFQNIVLVELSLPEDKWVLGNGIGVVKDNHALIESIEQTIEALKAEGVISALEQKWFKGGSL